MIQFVNNVWYGDDTYNSNELKKISQEIREGNWQYKGSSGTIGDDNKFWYQPLTEQHTNFFRTITNNKVIRAYANGQTMTQHSGFHADDGDMTYLIYADEWSLADGGGTEFLLNDNTTCSVYPKFNRIVKFKADISHRALPNIKQHSFRMTIALKTHE
jgi:hypothetical protein